MVTNGVKYVVRTEMMFRCVDRGTNTTADSQFQRMALYEQVGDLILKGDASAPSKVYQEALGLQIAFHGQRLVFCAAVPFGWLPPPIGVGLPHMVRGNSTWIAVASPLSASVAWVVRGAG